MFRTVSQIAIHYRGQALSAGKIGPVEGGDRLPWVEMDGKSSTTDNYAVLDGRDWQVHVYGTPAAGVAEACAARNVALHVFAWQDAMAKSGLTRSALYLVRPDGYVALADSGTSAAALLAWLDAHAVAPRTSDGRVPDQHSSA
jgi:hypothetical protein